MMQNIQTTIIRGLSCRCCQCGRTGIYDGLLKVREACGSCGLDMSRQDSGDGPTVFLIFAIGLVAAVVLLFLVFILGLPIWQSIAAMVVLVFLLTIAMLRPSKSLLIALAWHHSSGDKSARH